MSYVRKITKTLQDITFLRSKEKGEKRTTRRTTTTRTRRRRRRRRGTMTFIALTLRDTRQLVDNNGITRWSKNVASYFSLLSRNAPSLICFISSRCQGLYMSDHFDRYFGHYQLLHLHTRFQMNINRTSNRARDRF